MLRTILQNDVNNSQPAAHCEFEMQPPHTCVQVTAHVAQVYKSLPMLHMRVLAGADGVDTQFLGDEAEFALDLAAKMIENTCGTMYGKTAGCEPLCMRCSRTTFCTAD